MKFQLASLISVLAATVSAHSWLECVDTDVSNLEAAKANPALDVQQTCKGFPRNKVSNGDWIQESKTYLWDLNNNAMNPDGLACRPSQTNTYPAGVPMTTAKPGQTLRLRHWGNGHSRYDMGSPLHRDPGVVRLYHAGKKETEIRSKSELNENNWVKGAQSNFSADAVIEVVGNKMNEKGNYFDWTIPSSLENGRHMFVWVWAWDMAVTSNPANFNPGTDYNNALMNSWTTCFDILIEGSSATGSTNTGSTVQPSSPVASSAPANNICASKTCLKGGMAAYTCTGSDCPACWYAAGDKYNCFDYKDGKCPFGGAYDCKKNLQTRGATRFERTPFE
ncbi:hypothetical protein L873DRAFT_1675563 [Choiromyces venosus 120613-1]|uniref:Chitin-binding type-4 domain-containing protein n=1 Tax=Choiromyces venosus 120613-1 TaxID=1336337 RepID=A0A3N4JX66_9PEZI|nr:hypothetical protein L873DRAFT_1675563 [Choiromyces venosus 120613-1]